jgi:hypothetical protein
LPILALKWQQTLAALRFIVSPLFRQQLREQRVAQAALLGPATPSLQSFCPDHSLLAPPAVAPHRAPVFSSFPVSPDLNR